MKKAEIASQGFIYIIAGLLFTLILIYGIKAIAGLSEKADYVKLIDFKTSLESEIKNVGISQDRIIKVFDLPDSFDEICFVNMNEGGDDKCNTPGSLCKQAKDNHRLPLNVWDAWSSNITQNVFLVPSAQVMIETTPIEVYNESKGQVGAECYPITKGKIKLILEGAGDRTKIYPYVEDN